MKILSSLFLDHPRSVGETYAEHFGVATSTAARLIAAGAACGVHGVLPFLFPATASTTVTALHTRMQARRRALPLRSTGEAAGADCYVI